MHQTLKFQRFALASAALALTILIGCHQDSGARSASVGDRFLGDRYFVYGTVDEQVVYVVFTNIRVDDGWPGGHTLELNGSRRVAFSNLLRTDGGVDVSTDYSRQEDGTESFRINVESYDVSTGRVFAARLTDGGVKVEQLPVKSLRFDEIEEFTREREEIKRLTSDDDAREPP